MQYDGSWMKKSHPLFWTSWAVLLFSFNMSSLRNPFVIFQPQPNPKLTTLPDQAQQGPTQPYPRTPNITQPYSEESLCDISTTNQSSANTNLPDQANRAQPNPTQA